MKLTIVGSGRAAWAFASVWARADRTTEAVVSRKEPSLFARNLGISWLPLVPESFAGTELVLFAVADGAIGNVYESVRSSIPEEAVVFHASGSLSSDLFDHESRFSLHPLRSLVPAGDPVDLSHTLFTWEGAPSTRPVGEEIARIAGGEFRAIETEKKVLYHAAAVFGANYVAAILEESAMLMERAGVPDARSALRHLAISAIGNWSQSEGVARFTGPIPRNEPEVVRQHLNELADHPLDQDAYRLMARILIDAIEKEAEAPDLHQIRSMIERKRQS